MRLITRNADISAVATRYLGSVIVAVLFAPVLPDVFVDWLGSTDQPDRNPWLRLAAVAVIAILAYLVSLVSVRWSARQARIRGQQPYAELKAAEVLVISLSLSRSGAVPYTREGRRTGNLEIAEFLAIGTKARTLVGVVSPEVDQSTVEKITAELDADRLRFVPVRITEAYEPRTVIWESGKIVAAVRELGIPGSAIMVDTTAGTVPMTLSMMRVAATLGARCAYVSSARRNNMVVPDTQKGHEFDPRFVVESV